MKAPYLRALGTVVDDGAMSHTDQQLIAGYTAHQHVRGFAARTIERRTWSLNLFADTGQLAGQTAAAVEMFLARWPSPQSRQSVRSDLHQFYKWAIARELLHRDPTIHVDSPRVPRREASPLTPADLQRAIAAARGDVLRAIMLGAYAGLRCSEIAALDASDVLHDQRLLVVRCGKGGRGGIVPLAPELAAVLPHGRGPVVVYANRGSVSTAIRRLFRSIGITNRPHDLRHSFGTAAAQRANGNMVLVASLMRHSSISTTQRYMRWSPAGAAIVDGLHDPPAAAA